MAQNILLMGADYPAVPAVVLPKTGGGTAKFVEEGELKTVYQITTSTPAANLGNVGDIAVRVVT